MIRPYSPADKPALLAMMRELWPDETINDESVYGQIYVYEEDGSLKGFIQVNVRPFVDGSLIGGPCPHIEGWFVAEPLRRHGIGGDLVRTAEDWARSQGYTEMTSDILLENDVSRSAHKALGYISTEKIEYFRKDL